MKFFALLFILSGLAMAQVNVLLISFNVIKGLLEESLVGLFLIVFGVILD
jgi:hypothetical protein